MKPCSEFTALIVDLASGEPLAKADAESLELHLRDCPACRAEVESTHNVLSRVTLPTLRSEEKTALETTLERDVLRALRKAEARRDFRRGAWTGLLAAAAAVTLYLVFPRTPAALAPTPSGPSAAEVESWALGDPFAVMLDETNPGPLDAPAKAPSTPLPDRQLPLDAQTHADLYLNPGE